MKLQFRKNNFIWYVVLLGIFLLSVAAVMRSFIIGLDVDEQYAITLAYRIAQGDIPVKEMWEPHQTSALIPAVFIKLYLLVFQNTEYMVIYIRVIGMLMQLAVSAYWYRVMKQKFDKKVSLLTAAILFHTLPKWIQTPEFANMQIWFLILTFLFVLQYCWTNRRRYCVAAGLSMVLEVLAYPSCVILFPLFIWEMWKTERKENRKFAKDTVLFAGICVACAVVFIVYLLSHMSFAELGTCMGYILADAGHSAGIAEKIAAYGIEFAKILIYLLFYGVIAGGLTWGIEKSRRIRMQRQELFFVMLLLVSAADQIRLWAFGLVTPVHPQVHYLILFLFGGYLYKKQNGLKEELRPLFRVGWLGAVLALAAVLLLTNLDVKASFVHLLPGMLCSFLLWSKEQNDNETPGNCGVIVILVFWVLMLIGARGYLVRENEGQHETVFLVKQKALYSAANGVYCSYMSGFQYNDDYSFLHENVGTEERILYIGHNSLTYLMDEREVCVASTISTPVYNEVYLAYYEINPQKMPHVVVIDRAYWEKFPSCVEKIKQWLFDNYDWENKEESEFLYILRKRTK